MKKTDIISTAVLQKAQESFLGKIGLCEVYAIDKSWVSTELIKNESAYPAQNVSDFEKALQSSYSRNIIVSTFLVNKTALEKMVMRAPSQHRIFYTTYPEE